MALTGELSDLSLAELIEFFCNQRKTGRLKVIYPTGPGYFYLQSGSVVHARIGELRGIEAVYYALTLPNASFTFSPAFEAPEQTINQPWTSVVLEGLRRMDEGVHPRSPFPDEDLALPEEIKPTEQILLANKREDDVGDESHASEKALIDFPGDELTDIGALLSQVESESRWANRPWTLGAVIGAVVLIVAVVGVPWGLYARSKAAKLANQAKPSPAAETVQPSMPTVTASQPSAAPEPSENSEPATNSGTADLAANRQREARAKARAKAQETASALNGPQSASAAAAVNPNTAKSSPAAGAKKVTVQVTYDENGRVTQASGGDATALRIARQKRFPPGKPGSATITIPIN